MLQVTPYFHKINTQDTHFKPISHNSQRIINNKIQMEIPIPLLIPTLLKLLSMERYFIYGFIIADYV